MELPRETLETMAKLGRDAPFDRLEDMVRTYPVIAAAYIAEIEKLLGVYDQLTKPKQ
jgi:hypothetical protein